jgi:hypothetical protein
MRDPECRTTFVDYATAYENILLLILHLPRAMRTRHQGTLTLFTGLLFAFVVLAPTSALAQRTAETVESAPERATEMGTPTTTKTSASAPKSAHTPATTIENANGNVILQTGEGGSLLAPDHGGAIPAEGAGTRMMWYPAESAFRAGEVSGTQWNASNVGSHSAAFGIDTEASNFGTMAIGEETVASGVDALATGFQTTASGLLGTTMGWGTEASGDGAVAMGKFTTARAINAVAMGKNTEASDSNAVAMGLDTEASDSNAVAMGTMTVANDANAVALGFDMITVANHSLAVGRCNSTTNQGALFTVGNGLLNSAGDGCQSFSDALSLTASGDMTIAGNLTESSDRRLKTNIEPLGEGTLRKLSEIDPVRFRFKNEKTHPAGIQIGLIAQEVRNEFPELVSERNDGLLSLSYTKFSAVLLKGLQEQQAQLDEKTEKIADLNAELEIVSNQQEKLKQRLATLEAQTESSSILAGWSGSGLLAVLFALGIGLGAGLLWRGRVVVREAQSL